MLWGGASAFLDKNIAAVYCCYSIFDTVSFVLPYTILAVQSYWRNYIRFYLIICLFFFSPYNSIPPFSVEGYITRIRVGHLVEFLIVPAKRDTEISRLDPLSLLGRFVWCPLPVFYLELFWAYRCMYLVCAWAKLKGPHHGWEPWQKMF